jgi:hypothetical protein
VEFVYVITDSLEVLLTNEVLNLAAGDAFTFPGREPYSWRNASETESAETLAGAQSIPATKNRGWSE